MIFAILPILPSSVIMREAKNLTVANRESLLCGELRSNEHEARVTNGERFLSRGEFLTK